MFTCTTVVSSSSVQIHAACLFDSEVIKGKDESPVEGNLFILRAVLYVCLLCVVLTVQPAMGSWKISYVCKIGSCKCMKNAFQ